MPTNDPRELLRQIGQRIKQLRGSLGLSQEAFAERLDVTGRYVQRVEGGGQNVSVKVLAMFADGLDTTVADLLKKPRPELASQVRSNPASRGKRKRD